MASQRGMYYTLVCAIKYRYIIGRVRRVQLTQLCTFRHEHAFMAAIPATYAELWREYSFATVEPLIISFPRFVDYSMACAKMRLSPAKIVQVYMSVYV